MAALNGYPLDTSDALYQPSRDQIELRVERLGPGLWKIGSCFVDLLGTRPRDAAHYDDRYFDRNSAVLLAWGFDEKGQSALIETAAIRYAKFQLGNGVNTKSRDDVPHDNLSAERPGAIYAVPVRPDVATTQEEFKRVHVSYYMERTHGNTTKQERVAAKQERKRQRVAAKRQQLLDQLINAIPMPQLLLAFESPTSPGRLWKLQRLHGFKESNTTVYKELRAIFDEMY